MSARGGPPTAQRRPAGNGAAVVQVVPAKVHHKHATTSATPRARRAGQAVGAPQAGEQGPADLFHRRARSVARRRQAAAPRALTQLADHALARGDHEVAAIARWLRDNAA